MTNLPSFPDDIRALYGPYYAFLPARNFSIITSGRVTYLDGVRFDFIVAQVIVYLEPNSLAQWKLLTMGNERDSVAEALKSLWIEIQAKVWGVIGEFLVDGDWEFRVWDGVD